VPRLGANIFHRAQTFFKGRKHFSASANIFHGAQTFSFLFFPGTKDGRKHFSKAANISQQARTFSKRRKHFSSKCQEWVQTFFIGRKHFHLSARPSAKLSKFAYCKSKVCKKQSKVQKAKVKTKK
jgi:hypothetical protein